MPTSPKAKPAPRIRPVKITGARGDWIADVEGERLAVIHDTWWSGKNVYRDPMTGVDVETKRYTDYVEKLRESDRVVVQRDKGQGSLERDGYVGVFSFKDLQVDPAGPIEMTLTARIASSRK